MNELDTAIQNHSETAFAFLARLVSTPSMVGQEQAALEVFAEQAEATGLTTSRLPLGKSAVSNSKAGIPPAFEPGTEERYQLLACTTGEGPLRLLLNGHIDVVPAETPELWTHPPFEAHREDGKLFGRGAADMKSGFAVGMLALLALRDVRPDLFSDHRLGFIAVVEEENSGNGTLSSIVEHDVTAPEIILLEPTSIGMLVGGAGVIWVDLLLVAASGHAQSANQQINAVELGMRLVARLEAWSQLLAETEPDPNIDGNQNPYSVNLGKVNAGDWTSSVPVSATFSIRLGFPRGWSADKAETELRTVISEFAAADPDFPAPPKVTLTGLRAEGYSLDLQTPLARDLAQAHEAAHGEPPRKYSIASTTDARIYLNEFSIPAICYGADGHRLHGIDEYVELESIIGAARTLARFILMRFTDEKAGTS